MRFRESDALEALLREADARERFDPGLLPVFRLSNCDKTARFLLRLVDRTGPLRLDCERDSSMPILMLELIPLLLTERSVDS